MNESLPFKDRRKSKKMVGKPRSSFIYLKICITFFDIYAKIRPHCMEK